MVDRHADHGVKVAEILDEDEPMFAAGLVAGASPSTDLVNTEGADHAEKVSAGLELRGNEQWPLVAGAEKEETFSVLFHGVV